jgi:hypothetical protein
VVSFTPKGKEPPVPIGWEAGWAPAPVWTVAKQILELNAKTV